MTDYHVTCINKPDRQSTHEHITHIGNVAAGWRITRDAAIRRIDSGADRFYTLDARGNPMYVGVVREPGKHAYCGLVPMASGTTISLPSRNVPARAKWWNDPRLALDIRQLAGSASASFRRGWWIGGTSWIELSDSELSEPFPHALKRRKCAFNSA
jgi:hypothetical protein